MARRWFSMVAGLIAALLVLPLLLADAQGPKEPSAKVKKALGEPTLKILAGATRVECFRIGGRPSDEVKPGDKVFDGYPITATAKEQGQAFAGKLAGTLTDDNSLFSLQARCFFPGVGFRIWKDKESVDVVVCYMCTGLRLTTRDADGKILKTTGGGFKANWTAWVNLAKEAFPDDAEIQKLDGKDSRGLGTAKPGL